MAAGLALAAGRRSISNGNEFEKLFPAPTFSDPILNQDGDVDYTLRQMARLSRDGQADVALLAPRLQGSSVLDTAANIHAFVLKYIQYAQDKPGVEQLRTPARAWKDRKAGVDCDCMAIFESALLRKLNISHRYRIVKFADNDFEHVYIVIPRDGTSFSSGQIVLDGVIHQFDREKPYYQAQDYDMNGNKVQMLNGIPIQALNGLRGTKQSYSQREVAEYNSKLKLFLQAQRAAIVQNPASVSFVNPQQAIANIDFALKNWDNEHDRITAVQELATKEQQYNPGTNFFRSVLAFFDGTVHCDKVCAAGYVRLSPEVIESIHQGRPLSGTGLGFDENTNATRGEKNQHGLMKTVMAGPRNAYLLLVRLNLFHWADKFAPGFFPVHHAGETGDADYYTHAIGKGGTNIPTAEYNLGFTMKFGFTAADHLAQRRVLYDKILYRWWMMGGDWTAFKNVTLKGAHKMLSDLRSLPGYQYWCKYDDYYHQPNGTAGALSVTPDWKEVDGLGAAELGDPATAGTAAHTGRRRHYNCRTGLICRRAKAA